jgi:glycosyltransferase involved in cell wall biosynthesis
MLRFSLITPAYRAQSFLADLAVSLLQQKVKDWEWLVVADDLQADIYEALLRPLIGKKLTILSTGRIAAGPSVARNLGLEAAQGDLLCCVDADDFIQANRLSILGKYALKYGIACDNHQVIQYETHAFLGRTLPPDTENWVTLNSAMHWTLPFFPVFHRHYLQKWDEDIFFAEDVLFNLRLLYKLEGIYIHPQPLLSYRTHKSSICNTMPEGYFRAKNGYQTILNKLSALDELGKNIYLNECSPQFRTNLLNMFKHKFDLNEQFWNAYQARKCQNFSEFQAQLALS